MFQQQTIGQHATAQLEAVRCQKCKIPIMQLPIRTAVLVASLAWIGLTHGLTTTSSGCVAARPPVIILPGEGETPRGQSLCTHRAMYSTSYLLSLLNDA